MKKWQKSSDIQLWLISSNFLSLVSLITWSCFIVPRTAQAQIIQDGTTSETIITDDCQTTCTITGGVNTGNNLFHSFSQFNVSTGETVLFADPNVSNIFTRVTGKSISQIFGTLGVSGGNANLILLNPNGIIFGANARLDLKGSFVATTADSIQFGNQGFLSSSPPENENLSLLTINPSAFLFNQINPTQPNNAITLQSGALLSVPNQESIVLLGGNSLSSANATEGILIDSATLQAPGGQIELGAVGEAETIGLDNNFQLSFPDNIVLANISLTNGAVISTSGEGGGNIQVKGNKVTLTEDSTILADTLGNLDGIGITIEAEKLIIQGDSFLSTSTFGSGAGGNLTINTTESIELIGNGFDRFQYTFITGGLLGTLSPFDRVSGLFASTTGVGSAGNIILDTKNLTIQNGAAIFTPTFGENAGGNIMVNTSELVELRSSGLLTSATLGTTGKAGDITINTGKLMLQDGAVVLTSTFGEGNGGDLVVNASESVQLRRTQPGTMIPTGLFTNTVFGTGEAGNIQINTGKLTVLDGAQVSTASGAMTRRGLIPFGGQGGNVVVNADESVEVSGISVDGLFFSRLITDTRSTEAGGNLTINTRKLMVSNQAIISSATLGEGKGGNLTIRASESVKIIGMGFDSSQETILTALTDIVNVLDVNGSLFTGTCW